MTRQEAKILKFPVYEMPEFRTICILCEGEARHISGPLMYCKICLRRMAERSDQDISGGIQEAQDVWLT